MLSKIEEIALITRCVAVDDRRAFERLVEEYSPGLRRFIFNLTMGDAALTDDISQDAFIKAYTSLRSFKGMARFKTWLYRIAYNEYVTSMRRRSEEHLADDSYDRAIARNDSGSSSQQRLTEMRHDIEVGMRALSDIERTLVLLFYLEDRPIKEIVKITSLPEGTVKSYLSRAKSKMAQAITEYNNHEL